MPNSARAIHILNILLLLALTTFFPLEALARGGGGGSSGGGGLLALILWPFFLIYSTLITAKVVKKNQECLALTQQLSTNDGTWNMDNIKAQIETAYFKMQEAWMKRDQSICRDYVTDRLYSKHKMQTDEMIQQHRQNIMENINLIDSKIVQIMDFKDDSKDSFWVYIKGSMIDYIIDDRNGNVVKGDKTDRTFNELWKFNRIGNKWLLDEIRESVSLSELGSLHSFTEGNPVGSQRMQMSNR